MKRHQASTPNARFKPAFFYVTAALALAGLLPQHAIAQVDAHTLLLLQFDGTLNGAQGETPTTASGVSFSSGVVGQAASFPAGNDLEYASSGNINAQFGTLEFFIKPTWAGNDNDVHNILTFGGGSGIVFSKDGANNLREYFNRFGTEVGSSFNVASWQANQTHYVAYTWDNSSKLLDVYVDGQLEGSQPFASSLPTVSASTFRIGGDTLGTGDLAASLDELRISDIARSSAEIQARYAALVPEPSGLMLMLLSVTAIWLSGFFPIKRCG